MPEQPVDITKVGNPSLTTTVAAMPEQDGPEKPAVSSGGNPMNKKQPRFGFATRRFHGKAQTAGPVMQAAETQTFANAPEFFNDAVNDIELADEADKKGKTKKFLMIGGIAVAAIALFVFGIIALSSGIASGQKQAKASLANRLKNIIANGEDKTDSVNLKIEQPSDLRKLFIYKDAIADTDACKKTNSLIGEVAKKNNIESLSESISDVCLDLGYRQIPTAAIIAGANTTTQVGFEQYVDGAYKTRSDHREEIESLRIEQGHVSIQLIQGLMRAGCVSGRDIVLSCQSRYNNTDESRNLTRAIAIRERRYWSIIMAEFGDILSKIDGSGENND